MEFPALPDSPNLSIFQDVYKTKILLINETKVTIAQRSFHDDQGTLVGNTPCSDRDTLRLCRAPGDPNVGGSILLAAVAGTAHDGRGTPW